MMSTDITSISTMNLKELAQVIEMKQQDIAQLYKDIAQYQELVDFKNQKVIALKKTAFESLKEMVEITGSNDIVDEVAQEVKVFPISGKAEQASKNEEPEQSSEQTDEIVEPEQETITVKENVKDARNNMLPSFDDLDSVDCDTILESLIKNTILDVRPADDTEDETPDPFEYGNEEEYETMKKRAKMLQPMEAMPLGEYIPRIQTLGYKQVVGDSDFKQHLRAINADGYAGNTLTTEISPWLYIPEHLEAETIDITTCPDIKKCA